MKRWWGGIGQLALLLLAVALAGHAAQADHVGDAGDWMVFCEWSDKGDVPICGVNNGMRGDNADVIIGYYPFERSLETFSDKRQIAVLARVGNGPPRTAVCDKSFCRMSYRDVVEALERGDEVTLLVSGGGKPSAAVTVGSSDLVRGIAIAKQWATSEAAKRGKSKPETGTRGMAQVLGDFGQWKARCDATKKDDEVLKCQADFGMWWEDQALGITYSPIAPLSPSSTDFLMVVVLTKRSIAVTARIDGGAPHVAKCSPLPCQFELSDRSFYAGLKSGTTLVMQVTQPGKPSITLNLGLVDMRRAWKAAADWWAKNPNPPEGASNEKIGQFGPWQVFCDASKPSSETRCGMAGGFDAQGDKAVLFYGPENPTMLSVNAEELGRSASASIDGGTSYPMVCEEHVCRVVVYDFYRQIANGKMLTMRLTAAGKAPIVLQVPLREVQQATAAVKRWLAQHP